MKRSDTVVELDVIVTIVLWGVSYVYSNDQ